MNWNWHPLHGNYGTVLLMGKVYYLTRPGLVLRVPVSTFEDVSWFGTSQKYMCISNKCEKEVAVHCVGLVFAVNDFLKYEGMLRRFASSAVTMII